MFQADQDTDMYVKMLYALLEVDVKTLIAVLFWGNLTSVILISSYQISNPNKKDLRLTILFCSAKICQAIGAFFLFCRGEVPDLLSVNVGNTIFFIGLYFESMAIATIIHDEIKKMYYVSTAILISSIVIFNLVETFYPDPSVRITMASLVMMAILSYPVVKLLTLKNTSAFKRVVGIFYLFFILLLLPRAIHALFFDAHIHTNFITHSLTFMALIFLMIYSVTAYLLLLKEKADKIINMMATTDFLTRLHNRYSFLDAWKIAFEKHKFEAMPISILFLDIDHFKQVNDTYGHAFGDDVLARLGSIIRLSLRECDLSCRYGGEEFVVFLARSGSAEAHAVAQKIMDEIARTSFAQHPEFSFTASIGIMAGVPKHSDTFMEFIENADRALYAAKNNGRNRIEEYLTSELARDTPQWPEVPSLNARKEYYPPIADSYII